MTQPDPTHDALGRPDPAKVTLFGTRLSPFVEKVARALELKDVAFTLAEPRSPTDFQKWNPQAGKMPVLDVGGERVYDSTLILRRLDELAPEPPLVDAVAEVAGRQRFLEDWSDESLYWYVMALRWAAPNAKASAAQVAASLPLPAFAMPVMRMIIRRQIGRQATAQGLVRLPLDVILDELGRRFDELLAWLGDSPFLFSSRPSVADLAIFGQLKALRSGPTPQGEELITMRPTLVAYAQRVDEATRAKLGSGS